MAIVTQSHGGNGGNPGGNPSGGPNAAAGNSYIAYDSLLLRADALSVIADSESAGQAIENGISWPTYGGGWQTDVTGEHSVSVGFEGVREAQGYAIHKHNLADLAVSVELQSSHDSVVWTTVPDSERMPDDNTTLFVVAPMASSARFWRLRFSGHTSGTLRMAQVFMGPVMQVHQPPGMGWTPPDLALNDEYITSRADGGDFLGRSLIRRGSKTMFSLSPVPEHFVRNEWLPFMRAAQEHPFYYAWNAEGFPTEVAYCYVDKKIPIPSYQTPMHLRVPLNFIALQL